MKPTRATHRPASPASAENPYTRPGSGNTAYLSDRKRLYLGWLYCSYEEFLRYLERREAELGIRRKGEKS